MLKSTTTVPDSRFEYVHREFIHVLLFVVVHSLAKKAIFKSKMHSLKLTDSMQWTRGCGSKLLKASALLLTGPSHNAKVDSTSRYVVHRIRMSDKSTVHRVVHACKTTYSNQGAPLLELSWYPFSKYMNFVADVNLASSLLHKSCREIRKNEA